MNTVVLQKKFNFCIQKALSYHLSESYFKIGLLRQILLKGVLNCAKLKSTQRFFVKGTIGLYCSVATAQLGFSISFASPI